MIIREAGDLTLVELSGRTVKTTKRLAKSR